MADIRPFSSLWCYFTLLLLCATGVTQTQDTGACRTRACFPRSIDIIQELNSRNITISSTCGNPAETFELRTAGEFADTYETILCNASDPALSHTTDFLYDFSVQEIFGNVYTQARHDTWWQSVNTEQDVALEVAFGEPYLFRSVILSFRSVRPLAMKFEKSSDSGETWVPLHYYAQNCGTSFPGIPQTSNSYNLPFCEQKYFYGHSLTASPGSDIQLVRMFLIF